jgi:hypothetical protein
MALCHKETVQQTAREEPGFTGTDPGGVNNQSARRSNNRLSAPDECSQFVAKELRPGILHFVTQKMQVYEVRPRSDKRGVDLISDVLPFGRLWYGEPDAANNAIGLRKVLQPFT